MPQSCNCTVPDDQTKENSETVQLAQMQEHSQTEDGLSCKYSILGSGLQVWQTLSCRADGASPSRTPSEVVFTASAGQPFLLEELACIQTSRDVDPRIASIPESWNYDALFEAHYSAWERVWAVCDFCPKTLADDELVGLRYSMFQLIGSCSSKDPTVSIGARGLSHTRYKGCYFWDTDLFMLPFFLHTDLEAAKNLCTYRVKTLPAAKAHAEKMNSAGARYPWMAALDGSEQCETWAASLTAPEQKRAKQGLGCCSPRRSCRLINRNFCAAVAERQFKFYKHPPSQASLLNVFICC